MFKLKNNVDEILFLKKKIKYELSHKGGTLNTTLFKENILQKHKSFCILSFYLSIVILLYIILNNYIFHLKQDLSYKSFNKISKKCMSGGGGSSNNNIIDIINNSISFINNSITSFLISNASYIFLFIAIILFTILIFIIYLFDYGIYVPCGGCQKSTTFIKCIPGTGHGSVTCELITEIKNFISKISHTFIKITKKINTIYKFIKNALNLIKNIISVIKNKLIKIFGFPLNILKKFFNFLKYIKVPDKWGFNLGELLLGGKTRKIIYYNNGKLRNKHGSNVFFKLFFKTIRIIIETPQMPKLTWPSFGGANKTHSKNISIDISNTPYIKPTKHNPTLKDSNTYHKPIKTNSVKSSKENTDINKLNRTIENKRLQTLQKKQQATQKLIDTTSSTLNKLSTKKQKINFIKQYILKIQQNMVKIYKHNKKINKLINTNLKPTFSKIAKLGISPNIDKNIPPPKMEIKNGLYILINIKYTDLNSIQKNAFNVLNKQASILNKNKEKLQYYDFTMKQLMLMLQKENNKISNYKNDIKDFLYMKFLETLISIDINPLQWLASFFNIIIKTINKAIKTAIINPCIKLIKTIWKLVKKFFDAIIGELLKISNLLLIPIYKMLKAFKPIFNVFYKVADTVKKLGAFNMIFYYFYDKVQNVFGFLGNIFILLFITILVIVILIGCPFIGGIYETYLWSKSFFSFIDMIIKDVIIGLLLYLFQTLFTNKVNTYINIYTNIINDIFNYSTNIFFPIIIISSIVIIYFTYFIFSRFANINFINKFITANTSNLYNKIYNKYNKKYNKKNI